MTGAESGIGRATSRLFAREGAKVVCADMAERGNPRTDRLIEADGGEAHFLLGDVSQKAVCEEMVSTAIDRFGGLDVVYLNAGTGVRKKIHEMSDEEWDHVINLNLYGVYHGVQAVLPHFMEQGTGTSSSRRQASGCGRARVTRRTAPRRRAGEPDAAAGDRLRPRDTGELRMPRPHRDEPHPRVPTAPPPHRRRPAAGVDAAGRGAAPDGAAGGGRVLCALPCKRGVVVRERTRVVVDGGQTISTQ